MRQNDDRHSWRSESHNWNKKTSPEIKQRRTSLKEWRLGFLGHLHLRYVSTIQLIVSRREDFIWRLKECCISEKNQLRPSHGYRTSQVKEDNHRRPAREGGCLASGGIIWPQTRAQQTQCRMPTRPSLRSSKRKKRVNTIPSQNGP